MKPTYECKAINHFSINSQLSILLSQSVWPVIESPSHSTDFQHKYRKSVILDYFALIKVGRFLPVETLKASFRENA